MPVVNLLALNHSLSPKSQANLGKKFSNADEFTMNSDPNFYSGSEALARLIANLDNVNKSDSKGRWQLYDGSYIQLITRQQFEDLPDGVELISIFGIKVVKGDHLIGMDTRGGFLSVGIPESDLE